MLVEIYGPVPAQQARTDATGRFELRAVVPGEYVLRAELDGFTPVQQAVTINGQDLAPLVITLSVGFLEQTMVTAAKTGPDDALSLPMSVSAVSNSELARLDTRTIENAAAMMPAVTFTQNGSYGQLSIRGIGTNAVNAGTDPSSAIYLDGVYLARPAMAFVDFLDLDRVEVLRGPQGTLYGRNAVGGALNLVSRVPTNDFTASARVTAGSLDEVRAEARAAGPLRRDRLMGSIAFARGARDGYVRDLEHPENRLGGDDLTSARGQMRVVFNQRADLLIASDVSDQDGTLLTYNKVLQPKPGITIDNPPDPREVRASQPASSGLTNAGASVRFTSMLTPSTTLVSLTAFRTVEQQFVVDADITELNLLITDLEERQQQWSEEITLSHRRAKLSSVAGLFLFSERDHQQVWVPQPQAGVQVRLDPRVEAGSAALFGQATVDVSNRWAVTAGLRYTRERKTIDNFGGRFTLAETPAAIPGSVYEYADSLAHSAWTPKIGVERRLARGIAYASASRGFKSGGFNLSTPAPSGGYGPESAWSYEAGVKAELPGGSRVAVSAFTMDYSDLQVQTPVGIGVFDIRNAAEATVRGVEIEGTARVARAVSAGGNVAWLDATYDRYIAVAIGGITGDVAGNRLNNAPEWSGRAWIEWSRPIGRARRMSIAADASAQSTVYYTPFNDTIQRQRPYGLLGARVEYGPGDRRWSLAAYVRNVTDTDYIMATFATSPAAFGGRPGAPRQVGVQFVVER